MIDQRARHRRRQEKPDHFLARPDFPQSPREKNGLHQRRAEADSGVLRVGHGETERMLARGVHEGDGQRTHPSLAGLPGVGEQFLHGRRTWKGVAVGGSGVPKLTVTGYGMRRGNFQRKRPF